MQMGGQGGRRAYVSWRGVGPLAFGSAKPPSRLFTQSASRQAAAARRKPSHVGSVSAVLRLGRRHHDSTPWPRRRRSLARSLRPSRESPRGTRRQQDIAAPMRTTPCQCPCASAAEQRRCCRARRAEHPLGLGWARCPRSQQSSPCAPNPPTARRRLSEIMPPAFDELRRHGPIGPR